MNDEEREINSLVTKFLRHMERYEVEDHNPYHRSEAEQALKFAAQLSSVVQVRQLGRIADALERIGDVMEAEQSGSIVDTIEAMANAARYQK